MLLWHCCVGTFFRATNLRIMCMKQKPSTASHFVSRVTPTIMLQAHVPKAHTHGAQRTSGRCSLSITLARRARETTIFYIIRYVSATLVATCSCDVNRPNTSSRLQLATVHVCRVNKKKYSAKKHTHSKR